MKFRFLVDNKTEDSRCQAEWGLSILIETGGKNILFDAGASPMFAENATRLGIDLAQIDALVISHGHYDHTEGVPTFTQRNEKAKIYMHQEALGETYGINDGIPEKEPCGILWSDRYIDSIRERLVFTKGRFPLFEHVTIVGNIPAGREDTPTETFCRKMWTKDAAGNDVAEFVPDPMNHEQILIAEEKNGIFIFSGCSHKGVLSILQYSRELFPEKKIVALVGGMHLLPAPSETREKILRELSSADIDYLFPVHCTGMENILRLRQMTGKRCVIAASGGFYEF